MTVMENLEIGGFQLPRKEAKERIVQVLEFFPGLKNRIKEDAGKLSGGEQQRWSPLPAPSFHGPNSSCWMNHPLAHLPTMPKLNRPAR